MYDPMVAKLIVWDADREQATARMLRALGEYEIGGLKTLLPFHQALLATPQWAAAETCRDLVEDREWLKSLAFPAGEGPADRDGEERVEQEYTVEVSGKRFEVRVIGGPGLNGAGRAPAAGRGPESPRPARTRSGSSSPRAGGSGETLISPLQGTVLTVSVQPGAVVEQGALICVIEAMKMENEITAHRSGTVTELPVVVGASVATGDTLAVIRSGE